MAFDYTAEGSLSALTKLRNIHPYFEVAIFYLSQFSESIRPPQGKGVFEIDAPVIYPRIAFKDDPYPIIQCREKIFSGETRIEISYGIFAILGMMGEFEKAVDEIVHDKKKQSSLTAENLWEADVSGLVRCIKDVLKYLNQACNGYPEEVPEIPPLTLSTYLLNDALQFIIGHELAHYLDPYYNFDYRNNQQIEVLDNCFELLKGLKSTPYKKYADQFLDLLDQAKAGDDDYLRIWSEEVLADFEGYHYLCTGVPAGYSGMRKLLAISLSFTAMRIVEYFESTLDSEAHEGFFVPIKWRAVYLQYMIYKKYGSKYEYFNEFTANEWGVYQIVDMLFERALFTVMSENGLDKEAAKEKEEESFFEKAAFCRELIEKMSEVSVSEAEGVFQEIDDIYRQNISDPGFKEAFQTKKMAEILCCLGRAFYEKKQYEEAYRWYYRGSTYFEASEELPGLPEADCYEQMGNLCYKMGDYRNAVGWYNETLFIRQKVLGIPARENTAIYLLVARNLIGNGEEDSAEKYLKAILEYTEDDGIRAEVFRCLGIISDNRMDYDEALKWFQMALDIKGRFFEADSPEMATLYNSIGTVLSCMEKFDAAERYLTHSYEIKVNSPETEPITITNSMFNLGMLELRRGRCPEALKWFREVLDMRRKYLEEDHPLVADTLQSIGTTYYLQNNYAEAQKYSLQAAEIFRKKLGRSHPKTERAKMLLEKIEELHNTQAVP